MSIAALKQILLPFGISLCLTSTLLGSSALAQQEISNRTEFPGRRIGGGTRGECLSGHQSFVALNPVNNLGVTVNHAPSIYFLAPMLTKSQQVEFILQDSNGNLVYETTFDVNINEEIVGIHLPEEQLIIEQDYHWYFSVICDPQDRSQNTVLAGWLRQVPLELVSTEIMAPETVGNEPDLASSLEQVMRYQEAGIWSDAIALLVELRQTYPNDNRVLAQWTQLLQTLELESVIDSPLTGQL